MNQPTDRAGGEGLPAEHEHVLGFVSDASVAIHDEPMVVWVDSSGEWWGGLPQSFIRLSDHDWTVDRWEPLPTRAGAEDAGEAMSPNIRCVDIQEFLRATAPPQPAPSLDTNSVANSTGEKTGTHGASKEAGGHSRGGLTPVSTLSPQPAPDAMRLSEQERHAIAHARYQVSQASIVNPDCCFDYDLVKDLLRVIDRAAPVPPADGVGEWRDISTAPHAGMIEGKNADGALFEVWWHDAAFKGFPKGGGYLCVPGLTHWRPLLPSGAGAAEPDPLADLVSRFAKALLAKLKLAQANGRSGWERDDWETACQQGLLRHIDKGDPRDVAAYCAFMWHHGWITATSPVRGEREAVRKVFDGWLERFEYGDPIQFTPAREYASDAVRDCRDAVLALLPVQPGAGEREADKSRRPADCPNVMACGWHHVRTEPEIGLYLCGTPGCPHMIQASSRQAPHSNSDVDHCIACNVTLNDGDLVHHNASGGLIHAACCGPERDSYTGADGGPLKNGEPIPGPWIYTRAVSELPA